MAQTMPGVHEAAVEDIPAIRRIGLEDLRQALSRGIDDFLATPTQLIFLALIYPIIGMIAARAAWGGDMTYLIFPLVVIDISQQAKKDPRYAVTVEDIKAYEAKYGPIPDGALVALRSDWYKKWPDMDALSGIDAEGKENAPGWSLEALEYIYKVRNAAANGHETLDTDSSAVAEEKGDLACERYVLDNDKLQVEVLANLDKVQPAGAVVIVSYPRIEGATGLPARVWAVTE